MDAVTLAAAKAYSNKRLNWRGDWAASTAYAKNDLVVYNGGLYRAPNAFTSGGSFVKANWIELVQQTSTVATVKGSVPRKLLTVARPYDPVNSWFLTNGPRCIGVDNASGISFWCSTTTLFLSNDGGRTLVADPGTNLGKPTGVTSAFTMQSMTPLGSQNYWLVIAVDNATNTPHLYKAPKVAVGTAVVWTDIKAGLTGGSAASWGLGISADGQTICWGDYITTGATGTSKIHRSGDSGNTWTDVYTISSTSKHFHDVKADPYQSGRWFATAGDGPATTTDYFLVSTDNGITWSVVSPVTTYPPGYQAVSLSFDDPAAGRGGYIFAAPDVTYTDLIVIDRTTLAPYATISDHNKLSVPNPGSYTDGKVVAGTLSTLTTTKGAPFVSDDVGRKVFSSLYPTGTTISGFTNSTTVTTSNPASGASNAFTFTIDRSERWNQNNFMGTVDPATGIYYFMANDDASGPGGCAPRFGLFALHAGATAPVLLLAVPQNAVGVWIDSVNKRVNAGIASFPLLNSITPS